MKGPTSPYQGQSVADQSATGLTGAYDVANNQLGMGQGFLGAGTGMTNTAAGLYGQAAGYTPQDIEAGQLAGTNLDPYMNPFQQNVIDTTMSEMWRAEQLKRQALGDEAMASGAWGGDRQGVEAAENARNFTDQRAGILSQLNSANFNNAQQMATGDINRRFQGDQANQAMRQGMYQFGTQGLGGLGKDAIAAGMDWYNPEWLSKLSQQGFNYGDTIAKNNLQAGELQRSLQQQQIDAAKLQWEQFVNQPYKGLAAITGSTINPGGTKTTQNPGALGILGAGISAAGTLAGMCDRSVKCDIEEIGIDEETGLKMYAFRYKSDPKTYPKAVGPMADEVEEMYPGSTRLIAGKRVILWEKINVAA